MKRQVPTYFVSLLLALCTAICATAQYPDPEKSTITCNESRPVSILLGHYTVLGNMIWKDAQLYGGDNTNAMITIEVRDENGELITGFPASIAPIINEGNLLACGSALVSGGGGGGIAYFDYADGGGSSDNISLQGVIANIYGEPLFTLTPILTNFRFNSPDLNADGAVNMSDTVLLAQLMNQGYSYRIDYFWDGVINNSDVVLFVQAMGSACN